MRNTGAPRRRRRAGPIGPVVTAARAVWVFATAAVQVCLLGSDANL